MNCPGHPGCFEHWTAERARRLQLSRTHRLGSSTLAKVLPPFFSTLHDYSCPKKRLLYVSKVVLLKPSFRCKNLMRLDATNTHISTEVIDQITDWWIFIFTAHCFLKRMLVDNSHFQGLTKFASSSKHRLKCFGSVVDKKPETKRKRKWFLEFLLLESKHEIGE